VELRISGISVRGVEIDARTGCAHYRNALDLIAVKFNCRTYYSCFYCHELEADHSARIWHRAQFDEKAVLCGACGARFNPGCALPHQLYFETSEAVG
jgi:uncharacterized CHY-type Zn-finger protein